MGINLDTILLLMLALLLSTLPFEGVHAGVSDVVSTMDPVGEYIPAATVDDHWPVGSVINGEPFQQCSQCQCCAMNNQSNCATMSCCYRIVCNQPGKPFGYCSLKPVACNCDNCS